MSGEITLKAIPPIGRCVLENQIYNAISTSFGSDPTMELVDEIYNILEKELNVRYALFFAAAIGIDEEVAERIAHVIRKAVPGIGQ